MSRIEKFFFKIMCGSSDQDISFSELCSLLESLGFTKRVKGSHHIYTKKGVVEILNIQPKGAKAKPYQVKQIRTIISRYQLELGAEQ